VDDRGKIIMPSTSVDSEEDDIGGFTNSWLFTIEGVDALLVDFYGQVRNPYQVNCYNLVMD